MDLEALYGWIWRDLRQYFCSRIGADLAEDAAQDVAAVLVGWFQDRRLSEPDKVRRFLWVVARNRAAAEFRRPERRFQPLADYPCPMPSQEQAAIEAEHGQIFAAAFSRLAGIHQAVLLLPDGRTSRGSTLSGAQREMRNRARRRLAAAIQESLLPRWKVS